MLVFPISTMDLITKHPHSMSFSYYLFLAFIPNKVSSSIGGGSHLLIQLNIYSPIVGQQPLPFRLYRERFRQKFAQFPPCPGTFHMLGPKSWGFLLSTIRLIASYYHLSGWMLHQMLGGILESYAFLLLGTSANY